AILARRPCGRGGALGSGRGFHTGEPSRRWSTVGWNFLGKPMKPSRLLFLCGSLSALLFVAASCGNRFQNCEETLTCSSQGSGGGGGQGGASGAGAGTSDCDSACGDDKPACHEG